MAEIGIGFEIKATEGKGRGIYALKPYKENDIIFEESPLVCCQLSWNEAYKYLACENCMRPLETAEENVRRLSSDNSIKLPFPDLCPTTSLRHNFVVCPHCGLQYCSETCRLDAFNKYHATLCLGGQVNNQDLPLNKLVETWKRLHYPPETSSIMLIAKILAMIRQSSNREMLLSKFNDFQSSSFNSELMIFHKLLGENYSNDLKELHKLTCETFAGEEFGKILTTEGFQSLFALVGTNGQGIGTSSFSVWERQASKFLDEKSDEAIALNTFIDDLYTKLDEVSGIFLNCEGTGLYSLQSKINHSCAPNAEITFPHSNNVLAVKALGSIKPGDEICISYLDECSLSRSRHSRQKELRENYIFACQCAMCEEQRTDPDVTSDEGEYGENDDNEMEH